MESFLGSGSHGVVFASPDRTSVTKYIRIIEEYGSQQYLSQDAITEPVALERLKQCKVPYIVQMTDHSVTKCSKMLGITLERLDELPKTFDNPEDVRRIIAQIFTGLACMHEVDVYHGDIKRDNIMISPSTGDVKIIDFSLSHTDFPIISSRWEELYTMMYRPPELLLGSPHFDRAKADVWAAGITACEILTNDSYMLRGKYWRETLYEIIRRFGAPRFSTLYPRWQAFANTVDLSNITTISIENKIKSAGRCSEAVSFIECACNPNPRERWTAAALLKHPYIQKLTAGFATVVQQPERVIIRGIARIHPLFAYQHNPERELITEELMRRLDIPFSSYTGAMNVCSTYMFESINPAHMDYDAIGEILNSPETFKFLSKHLYVVYEANSDNI